MEHGKSKVVPIALLFSVGSVLFSAHAGGGFATGNQENTYYVGLGWLAPFAVILATLLMSLTMREAMFLYNSCGFKNHKELFESLFQPFPKLEWLFEVFFYIMVIMAVAASVSGAASALHSYFGVSYYLTVVVVGFIVLLLTIFGAGIIRMASTYFSITILLSAITIFIFGLFKGQNIMGLLSANFTETGFTNVFTAIKQAFVYAGFQCVTLPTMLACGVPLFSKKSCNGAMHFAFVMNALALGLAVLMLIAWQSMYTSVEGGTVLPTLTVCREIGLPWLLILYGISLVLCLISTGVTTTFGFVSRFENAPALQKIQSPALRGAVLAVFILTLSMTVSMAGLTNIVKYGYGYCGYLGIVVVIIPMLTIGVYRNRKFIKEHPEFKG
jgi:Uncharacterized membrane protein